MDDTLDEFVSDTRPIIDLIGVRLAAIEEGSGDLSGLEEARRLLSAIDSRAEPLDLLRLRSLLGHMTALARALGDDAGAVEITKLRALRAAFDRLRWQVSVLTRLRREAPGDDSDLVAAERRSVARAEPGVPGRSATPGVLLEEEVERLRADLGPDSVAVPRAQLADLARLARESATARERAALPADPDTANLESALEALCRLAFEIADRGRERHRSIEDSVEGAVAPTPARRILLVDDQAFFRALLARVLTQAGYRVTTATSAREAFALASAGPPLDAVVTDIDLPETDGFGLARALLAHPRRRDLPVLGLASHADPDLFVRARAAGLRGVIGKFDRDALLGWLAHEVAGCTAPSHAA